MYKITKHLILDYFAENQKDKISNFSSKTVD